MIPTDILADGVKLLFGAGIVYGSVKASLNGAKADIKDIKETVKAIDSKVDQHSVDIAVLKERREHRRLDKELSA